MKSLLRSYNIYNYLNISYSPQIFSLYICIHLSNIKIILVPTYVMFILFKISFMACKTIFRKAILIYQMDKKNVQTIITLEKKNKKNVRPF